MKTLNKAIVWTVAVVGAVVLFAVIALAVHPLWIGAVAKSVARSVVPGVTGTGFDVEELGINLYSGSVRVTGVRLMNPAGFADEHALTLDSLSVDIDMDTLSSDTVVIRDVTLDGVYVTYVKNEGKYNYDIIAANATAGAGDDPSGESVAEVSAAAETDGVAASGEKDSGDVKVVIEKLTVKNARVKYGMITVPIPVDIVLTDLGKKDEGVSLIEAVQEIGNAVLVAVLSAGGGLEALGQGAIEFGGGSIKDAGKAIKDAGESLKGVGEEFKNLFLGK